MLGKMEAEYQKRFYITTGLWSRQALLLPVLVGQVAHTALRLLI